jgi:hypothetical protein
LKSGAADDAARIQHVARRILSRPLSEKEAPVVTRVLGSLRAHYQAQPDDAKKLIAVGESKPDPAVDASELAAWTMVVNQLLNLDEVLNK